MYELRLNDRVLAGQKNDLRVVDHLDSALHTIGGVPKPKAPRSQDRVTNSVKAFQRERGLKVDGHVAMGLDPEDGADRTEGPTLLTINADLKAQRLKAQGKKPPSPAKALPITAGVGKGQPNRAVDVATARRGLALMGTYPKKKALGTPDLGEASAAAGKAIMAHKQKQADAMPDPDLEQAILKTQAQLGAKQDGVMLPGGETQAKAGRLIDAKVSLELGDDPANPKPFEAQPNPPIARTWPDTPTRISVPFGSGMGMNTDDTDHRLASAHHAEIVKARANAESGAESASVPNAETGPHQIRIPGHPEPVTVGGKETAAGGADQKDKEYEWLSDLTVALFDRTPEQMQKDMEKAGAHVEKKGKEYMDFLLNNFGPQADVAEMVDGSDKVTQAARDRSFGEALEGLSMMLGGALSVPLPGSAKGARTLTEETVNAINKSKQAGDKVSAKANKWGIYDPPENWTDGSDIPDGRRGSRRSGGGTDPAGVRSGEGRGEQLDMEGRPLTARTVVGRTQDGRSGGPISKTAVDEVAKTTTGSTPKMVEKSALWDEGAIAEAYLGQDGRVTGIAVLKDLPPSVRASAAKHELGHAIDEIVKSDLVDGIPIDGLGKELRNIYSLGATGKPWNVARVGPKEHGYEPHEERAEFMAEALRFYMTDPEGMKAYAPRTAKRIRKWVNEHKDLKSVIQFNSVAAALGVSLALQDGDDDDGS